MSPKTTVECLEAKLKSTPKTAMLVLGMHRSGTSALTRVLNLLGAALPNRLMPPGHGNGTGHWESAEVAALHDEILASVGSNWNALTGPAEAWFDSPQADEFVEKIKDVVLSEYGDATLFVVKDPRLSLLFPLWSRALSGLGVACRPIIAVRNPMEVAQSIGRREGQIHPDDFWHVDRGGLMFVRYHLAAESWTRSHRRVFIHYDDLLRDWRGTARRLGEEFKIDWPRWRATVEDEIDGFLSISHRHHRETDDLAIYGRVWAEWVGPLYAALKDACAGHPIEIAPFDRIELAYDAACGAFARYLGAADAKRSELSSARETSQALRRQIVALTNSTSWRITAPLRRVAAGLRGVSADDNSAPPSRLNSGTTKTSLNRRRPVVFVSVGALSYMLSVAGLVFFMQGLVGTAPFASTSFDGGWSAAKAEHFQASPSIPMRESRRQRLSCLLRRYFDNGTDTRITPPMRISDPTGLVPSGFLLFKQSPRRAFCGGARNAGIIRI